MASQTHDPWGTSLHQPSLYSAAAWKYLAAAALAVLQIGLASILSRSLGPERFGQWALIQTALTFGLLFADAGTGTSLLKFASNSQNQRAWIAGFFRLRVLSGALAALTVVLALSLSGQQRGLAGLGWLALALACAGKSIGLAMLPPLQVQHRWKAEAITSLIGPAGVFAGVLVLLWISGLQLSVLLATISLAYITQALIGWWIIDSPQTDEPRISQRLVRFGIPLALNSTAYLLMVWLDKIFVVTMLGDRALGNFYAASVLLVFFRTAIQPGETLNQRWMLENLKSGAGTEAFFRISCAGFTAASVVLAGTLSFFSTDFLHVLNGTEYLAAGPVVRVLAIGLLARIASVPLSQHLIHREEKPSAVLIGQCCGIIVNVLLAYPAIKWFGLVGAAGSTSLAFLTTTLAYVLQIKIPSARQVAIITFLSIMTIQIIFVTLELQRQG